jgi:hypothetical protein
MVFLDRVRWGLWDGLDRVVLNGWVLLGLQIPHFVRNDKVGVRNDNGPVGMTLGVSGMIRETLE